MRHAEGGAQRIADAVAGAGRHARRRRRDRLPHADLRLEPRRQIRGIALDGRQRAGEQLQALQGQRFGRQAGARRCSSSRPRGRPSGCPVQNSSQSGVSSVAAGSSTTVRGANRRCRNDCLVLVFGLRDAGVLGELGGRQRGGNRDHADRHRRAAATSDDLGALEAQAIGLHGLGAVEAEPQAKLHGLGGIDHRAAADGDQQIGFGRARGLGRRPPRPRADCAI